jgi:hypothetical protein
LTNHANIFSSEIEVDQNSIELMRRNIFPDALQLFLPTINRFEG